MKRFRNHSTKAGLIAAILVITSILTAINAMAQAPKLVKLEDCLQQAVLHYPALENKDLIGEYYRQRHQLLSKKLLPTLDFNVRATYQSDVTGLTLTLPDDFPFTLPEISTPELDKDQYKFTIDLTHVVYDGGLTRAMKKVETSGQMIENTELDVHLYHLKEVVKSLYYRILFLQKTRAILGVLKSDLYGREKLVRVQVDNGMALKTNADIIAAEVLKIDQQTVEMEAMITASIGMLNVFTGRQYDTTNIFEVPAAVVTEMIFEPGRPELQIIDHQRNKLELSSQLISAAYMPRLMWFGQLGYGKPGLNMLENEFSGYFLVGAGLQMKLWDWRNGKREKEMMALRSKMLQNEKDVITRQMMASYTELMSEVNKFRDLIARDQEIIILRSEIASTYSSRLEFGVITSTEYLIEKNAEARARMDLEYHKIGLSRAMTDYLYLTGKL